jgi:hypothetical protein
MEVGASSVQEEIAPEIDATIPDFQFTDEMRK